MTASPHQPLEVVCRACGYAFTYSPEEIEVVEDVLYGHLWKSIKCKNVAIKCTNIAVLDSAPQAPCSCQCAIL